GKLRCLMLGSCLLSAFTSATTVLAQTARCQFGARPNYDARSAFSRNDHHFSDPTHHKLGRSTDAASSLTTAVAGFPAFLRRQFGERYDDKKVRNRNAPLDHSTNRNSTCAPSGRSLICLA